MTTNAIRLTVAGLACLPLLAGCGEINVRKYLPFGSDTTTVERPRTPANSVEYQCAGNKRFFLRTLEGGNAVWLILSEREVRLDRLGTGEGTRYSNGIAVLELGGGEATLNDGAALAYTGCKTGASPVQP